MASQRWIRPVMERSFENGAVVELDRGAAWDRAYRYRLMALEGSDATVIGAPIEIAAQGRNEFRLVDVGPNPGSGPVRIVFALGHAAPVEIDVFDTQGRRVTALSRGSWPPGAHEVIWDGRTRNGIPAPVGMYVVWYAYPGGQDRRAIVRVR